MTGAGDKSGPKDGGGGGSGYNDDIDIDIMSEYGRG
jgi:hypothetical protein